MKKILIIIVIALLGTVVFMMLGEKQPESVSCTMEAKLCSDGSVVGRSGPQCEFVACPDVTEAVPADVPSKMSVPEFVPPLENAGKRITKKPFGILIAPATSPVQPEHFRGYHTGADFEIFSEEAESAVSVRAICSGLIKIKRSASGYGGVVVQECMAAAEPITVVYGHLKLASVMMKVGEEVVVGDDIGVLGAGKSEETDGERKHLHLGVHKGNVVDIRGYTASEAELGKWIDPCQLFSCSL